MNFVVSAQTNWPMNWACAEGLSNRLNYIRSAHRQTFNDGCRARPDQTLAHCSWTKAHY